MYERAETSRFGGLRGKYIGIAEKGDKTWKISEGHEIGSIM